MTAEDRKRLERTSGYSRMRLVHMGYTEDMDGSKTQYVTDNVDCLPPDIRNYGRGWCQTAGHQLIAAIEETEREGYAVCLQVGDIYYETA